MNPSICTLIYSFRTVEDEQSWGTNNSKGRTGPENCAHKKARGLPLVCNRRFSVMRQTENKSCTSLREDFLSFFAPRAPRFSHTSWSTTFPWKTTAHPFVLENSRFAFSRNLNHCSQGAKSPFWRLLFVCIRIPHPLQTFTSVIKVFPTKHWNVNKFSL